MGRKKKSTNMYFSEETQTAIIEYNESEDSKFKSKLYSEKIYPALYQLCEILIRHYGFIDLDPNYNNLHSTVLSFLTESLCKYKEEKGKAFSYFTVIGRNFLILLKKKKAVKNNFIDVEHMNPEEEFNIIIATENRKEKIEYFLDFVEYMEDKLSTYFICDDLRIADSLLSITKSRYDFEKLNKKMIFFMVREMVGKDLRSTDISRVINKMHAIYKHCFNLYKKNGHIDKKKVYAIY